MVTMLKALLDAAAKVSTDHQLVAFAIVAVLIVIYLIARDQQKKRGPGAATWPLVLLAIAILLGALIAVLGPIYLNNYASTITLDVSAIGIDGRTTTAGEASVDVGGQVKKVDGGWEIDVPADKVPASGTVEVTVSQPGAFAEGRQTVDTRGHRHSVPVKVTLVRDTSARIRGNVLDAKGNGVVGASVQVAGYPQDAVLTTTGGGFDLPAHAAPGQQVMLHAEKNGLGSANKNCPAGDMPAQLTLKK